MKWMIGNVKYFPWTSSKCKNDHVKDDEDLDNHFHCDAVSKMLTSLWSSEDVEDPNEFWEHFDFPLTVTTTAAIYVLLGTSIPMHVLFFNGIVSFLNQGW